MSAQVKFARQNPALGGHRGKRYRCPNPKISMGTGTGIETWGMGDRCLLGGWEEGGWEGREKCGMYLQAVHAARKETA
eukprot:scaffold131_cov335-Pavlova_lutheri.AAC.15